MSDFFTSTIPPVQGSSSVHLQNQAPKVPDLTTVVQTRQAVSDQDKVQISQFAQVKSLNQQGSSILEMMQRTGLDEKTISNYLSLSIAPNPYLVSNVDKVEISQMAQLRSMNQDGSSMISMMQKTGLDDKTISNYLGLAVAPTPALQSPRIAAA